MLVDLLLVHLGDKSHLQGYNILSLCNYFTTVTNLGISMQNKVVKCENKVVKPDVDLKPIAFLYYSNIAVFETLTRSIDLI